MSFSTFAVHGSLLILAGLVVLYGTTRINLTFFRAEETLPYNLSRFWKWLRNKEQGQSGQEEQEPKKAQSKVQVGTALMWGLAVTLFFTLMPIYSDFLRRVVWVHVPELATSIPFVVAVLLSLKSNKYWWLVGLCMVSTTVALNFAPSWLTVNLAVVVGVFAAYIFWLPRTSFARATIVLAVVAALYDAVQVWLTHEMQEKVTRSVRLLSPNNILIPESLDLSAPVFMTMGFGDIFLPGVLVIVAGRVGQRVGSPRLYRAALLGYAIGLVLAVLAAYISSASQPGLVYIVSSVALVTYLAARQLGLVEELKIKISSPRTAPPQIAATKP